MYQNPDTDKPQGAALFSSRAVSMRSRVWCEWLASPVRVPPSRFSPTAESSRRSSPTGAGAYGFPEVSNFSFSGALVGASRPGYFTDTKYILMTGPSRLDFDLIEAARIPFGQMVRSPVGDARCASLGYGGMGGALCAAAGGHCPRLWHTRRYAVSYARWALRYTPS